MAWPSHRLRRSAASFCDPGMCVSSSLMACNAAREPIFSKTKHRGNLVLNSELAAASAVLLSERVGNVRRTQQWEFMVTNTRTRASQARVSRTSMFSAVPNREKSAGC